MRSDRSILSPVFTQVHWCTNERYWVGICKQSDFKLANMLSESKILARLMITRFGNAAEEWFPDSVLILAAELTFDDTRKKLIDKSTCDYAPLTFLQATDMNDGQLLALFSDGATNENNQMQIDGDDSNEYSMCDTEDSEDNDDDVFISKTISIYKPRTNVP